MKTPHKYDHDQDSSLGFPKQVHNTPWPVSGYPSHAVHYLDDGTSLPHQRAGVQDFQVEFLEHVHDSSWNFASHPSHAEPDLVNYKYSQGHHLWVQVVLIQCLWDNRNSCSYPFQPVSKLFHSKLLRLKIRGDSCKLLQAF